jgi:hypothetical protein
MMVVPKIVDVSQIRENKQSKKKGLVSLESDVEDQADVGDIGSSEIFENGNKVQQLIVVSIREPTADGDSMLRVENVRRRRVVDDDGILEVSSDLRKVLDVVSLVVVATLSEEPVVHNFMDIQLVE